MRDKNHRTSPSTWTRGAPAPQNDVWEIREFFLSNHRKLGRSTVIKVPLRRRRNLRRTGRKLGKSDESWNTQVGGERGWIRAGGRGHTSTRRWGGRLIGWRLKKKTRGVCEMRTTEAAGASLPASPPCSPFYHFLYISRSIETSTSYMCPSNTRLTSSAKMGFREIDGYVVRDVKREPEVSRLKPGHVQVLFWIIPKDKNFHND